MVAVDFPLPRVGRVSAYELYDACQLYCPSNLAVVQMSFQIDHMKISRDTPETSPEVPLVPAVKLELPVEYPQ
jgi:hypothetical protein